MLPLLVSCHRRKANDSLLLQSGLEAYLWSPLLPLLCWVIYQSLCIGRGIPLRLLKASWSAIYHCCNPRLWNAGLLERWFERWISNLAYHMRCPCPVWLSSVFFSLVWLHRWLLGHKICSPWWILNLGPWWKLPCAFLAVNEVLSPQSVCYDLPLSLWKVWISLTTQVWFPLGSGR